MATDNPPEFLHTFENVTVNPGSPVSLKCSASGNPLPQITWSLDGAQVPEDQSFRSGDYVTLENTVVSYVNISRAGVEHSGEFTCTAKNDAGQIHHSRWLRVPGPPFVRPMKNQTIVAGETMKIRCPAGGYPIHRISWEREYAGSSGLEVANSNRNPKVAGFIPARVDRFSKCGNRKNACHMFMGHVKDPSSINLALVILAKLNRSNIQHLTTA
ncbi:down syndrome cell adhesion molecule-like protein Dscam2 [Trichonephila clavipes]|nr:down syndrome cell adhesion molecule-like protein Dscam2 [Trichonephila clavipes]